MAEQLTRRTLIKGMGTAAAAGSLVAAGAPAAQANTVSPRIAIIGSGYGGAVAALRLTRAGYKVDLIEMGADWDNMAPVNGKVFTKMVSPSERSMWFKDKTDLPFSQLMGMDVVNKSIKRAAGVLDVEKFDFMKIYVGRGVGGGSLVNGGMAVTPRQSYFKQVMPKIDSDEMYARYFPRVNRTLGVNAPPQDFINKTDWYRFTRVAVEQAKKAGIANQWVPNVYDWEYMKKEATNSVPKSALDGQVIFGNDYGKKSLPKTLIKQAKATGRLSIKSLTEVRDIYQNSNGTFTLDLKTIDFYGKVLSTQRATYDKVIMAAGSVGTSRLMMKAKNKGTIKNMPATTGKSWGPNGNIMAARYLWFTGTGGQQATIPAMGLTNWDDSANSVFAEVAPFPTGLETFTSLYLAITNNPNLGAFTWNAGTQNIGLNWNKQMAAPSVASAKKFLDKINAAYPGTRYRTDLFSNNEAFADYFSYHPLGGMVLGESTNLYGEVNGVPNLFIMDGSMIPGKVGVNPFVTITALAERNMDYLLSKRKF